MVTDMLESMMNGLFFGGVPTHTRYFVAGYVNDDGNVVENDYLANFAAGPFYTYGTFAGTFVSDFVSPYANYDVSLGLTAPFQDAIENFYISEDLAQCEECEECELCENGGDENGDQNIQTQININFGGLIPK